MRPIDADALIEEIHKRIKSAYEWYDEAQTEEVKLRAEQAIATFCEVSLTAKKMPTVEPERKKGRWIKTSTTTPNGNTYYSFACDVCGDHHNTKWSFCPYCGADMREGD